MTRKLNITQKLIVQLDRAIKKSRHEIDCDDEPCCCWMRQARQVLKEAVELERKKRRVGSGCQTQTD